MVNLIEKVVRNSFTNAEVTVAWFLSGRRVTPLDRWVNLLRARSESIEAFDAMIAVRAAQSRLNK